MANQFIPPNGLAGFAQQTPAVQALYSRRGRSGGGRKRRKKKAAAVKRASRRKSAKRAGKKFAKGSAAAKRHMAKLRKMRKK